MTAQSPRENHTRTRTGTRRSSTTTRISQTFIIGTDIDQPNLRGGSLVLR